MFYNYLFPQYCREKLVSVLILSVRVIFGVLFFMHGVDKLMNFNELSQTFPDILGFGSYMTLMVANVIISATNCNKTVFLTPKTCKYRRILT